MKRRKERDGDGFEALGGYMNVKISKLDEQFKSDAKNLDESKKQSTIFKGVSIFVNGHTEPPAEVLRSLMVQHGGVFHCYQLKTTTHLIANNLPDAKLKPKMLSRFIRPEWIVDSIAAEKLLPPASYQLYTRSALQNTLNFQRTMDCRTDTAKPTAHSSTTKNYIDSRRLHLTTIRTMLKDYIKKLKENHTGVFPGLDRLKNIPSNYTEIPAGTKIVMLIDIDNFCVSVALRKLPQLIGKPVAVTNTLGSFSNSDFPIYQTESDVQKDSCSVVTSCNYEAQALGVHNGMDLDQALTLCPNLMNVPYNLAAYTEVSYALYDTVADFTIKFETVNCDELFVDCTSALKEAGVSPKVFTETLRADIMKKTGCTCSAGLGSNKLLARLALKKAKPNGQFYIQPEEIPAFMRNISVKDLPGICSSTTRKLQEMDVKTCMDLQVLSLTTLKTQLGEEIGNTLYRLCRGIDHQDEVTEPILESTSAHLEAEDFLQSLSNELSNKISRLSLQGRCITSKSSTPSTSHPGACYETNSSVSLSPLNSESKAFENFYLQSDVTEDLGSLGKRVSNLDRESKLRTPQSSKHVGVKQKGVIINKDNIENLNQAESQVISDSENLMKPIQSNLFDTVSQSELRALIEAWVETATKPVDYDVSMLVEHCVKQVATKQIDALDVTLKCLRRCIRKHRSEVPNWCAAYQTVTDQVQEAMVQTYKYPLGIFPL